MSAAVITGWAGVAFAELAAHTLPLMQKYAIRHGHKYTAFNLEGERAPSWHKIDCIFRALQSHELVVWLDADVVVLDGSRWVGDELPADKWHGLVEHQTECGDVPNCGVWVLRQKMLPVMEHVWSMTHRMDHPWWEQAAVLELLGYHVPDGPMAARERHTDLYDRTHWLSAEWNDHPQDMRRTGHARFVHVTQYEDRLATVKRYANLSA